MSVFLQLKNFLRNGGRSISSSNEFQSPEQKKAKKYENAARCVVNEENEAKKHMPKYEGLEGYKLIKKLGDGAFSNVYEAIDLETDQTVALKAVRKFELSPTQKASILKEVQIMRTIDHPSIVKLHRFIETKEYYFLVLELCEGGELFHQIVRLTYFSEDLARHCIRQVAEGIRYLHEEKGVVHRDIKPENLLFEPIPFMKRTTPLPPPPPEEEDEPKEDEGEFIEGLGGGGIGRVKIADFGLSKVVWDQHTMTPCGTVGYTAPEIVRDERYSKSVDMWALGCVLYTMLCGFPPFYDESIEVLTEKVARGHYTFLSPWWDAISADAKDLVSHLLCINPKSRYTIDQFLNHRWMQMKQKSPHADLATSEILVPASTTTSVATPTIVATPPQTIPCSERRRDVFSTGLTSMKEIFDVSYAVHRMAEERARRKEIKKKGKNQHGFQQAIHSQMLDDDEDHDDPDENHDDDVSDDLTGDETSSSSQSANEEEHERQIEVLRNKLADTSVDQDTPGKRLQQLQRDRLLQQIRQEEQTRQRVIKPPSDKRGQKSHKSKAVFDLNLDNATLLGRRKNNENLASPLVRTSLDTL
ncbi:kinase-like domain-containing protein [Radiomyces spectabilis]|uniref:kinase-like domain-containing protein n=1 Tax=Radiomyces spectabilis TaxID=64574 RepID=UPI00221F40CD|nr:kinase-like domain-containing protein [Radiomyces spectabilis]KAI8371386.1 kinase-like domain-containing protein [Radiomyces spectabilis]